MQKLLRKVVRHAAQYAVGYILGLFLMIAAMTCGIMQGRTIGMTVQLNVWTVMRVLLGETVLMAGLLFAAAYPFGCALAAGLITVRGYQAGLAFGWWVHAGAGSLLGYVVLILETAIFAVCVLSGCCTSAYMALHISPLSSREYTRHMLMIWIAQILCALVRCAVCAWAI